MESRLRVFLLSRAFRTALALSTALALQGCGLFGGEKPEQPLGSEPEIEEQAGPSAAEQPIINPEISRRRVREARIETEFLEVGAHVGLLSVEDFGSTAVFGLRAGYLVTEDLTLEFSAGTGKAGTTSYERLAGGPRLIPDEDRQFTYYAFNVGWNALPGELFIGKGLTYNTSFFFTAGMGATDFAGDMRFTANFGAGYRVFITDWAMVRLDFRDYLFDIDLLGEKKVANNLEGSLGLSFFF